MSSMRLLNLIGTIDDDLVTEALEYKGKAEEKATVTPVPKGRNRALIISLISAAACIALVIGVIFMMPHTMSKSTESATVKKHTVAVETVAGIDEAVSGDEAPAAVGEQDKREVDECDDEELEGWDFYSAEITNDSDSKNIMTDGGVYNIKVALKLDDLDDKNMTVSFNLADDGYAGKFYTYDGLLRLVKVEDEDTFDYNTISEPLNAPDEDAEKIMLDQKSTSLIFPYESEFGPLTSGKYLIVGYIYATDGDGRPIRVSDELIIP